MKPKSNLTQELIDPEVFKSGNYWILCGANAPMPAERAFSAPGGTVQAQRLF